MLRGLNTLFFVLDFSVNVCFVVGYLKYILKGDIYMAIKLREIPRGHLKKLEEGARSIREGTYVPEEFEDSVHIGDLTHEERLAFISDVQAGRRIITSWHMPYSFDEYARRVLAGEDL